MKDPGHNTAAAQQRDPQQRDPQYGDTPHRDDGRELPAQVFAAELQEVARRNKAIAERIGAPWPPPERAPAAEPTPPEDAALRVSPSTDLGLVGLAFSGGGIRSAIFNLGALQALYQCGAYARVDYLSTVSGGGYIGSCLQSLLADGRGFPFEHEPGKPESSPLRHLRQYSNYLAPRGLADLAAFPVLFVRGLVGNFLVLLPFLLLAVFAVVLLWGDALVAASGAENGLQRLWSDGFRVTRAYGLAYLAALALYPLVSYLRGSTRRSTWEGRLGALRLFSAALMLLLVIALVELQPIAIHLYERLEGALLGWLRSFGSGAAAEGGLAAGAQLPALFASAVGVVTTVLVSISARAGIRVQHKIRLYAIGIAGPLVFWLLFLVLARRATSQLVSAVPVASDPFGNILLWLASWNEWIVSLGYALGSDQDFLWVAHIELVRYLYGALVLLAINALLVDVNKTSLHSYYRDRLSRAFLIARAGQDERSLLGKLLSAVRRLPGMKADAPAGPVPDVLEHQDTFRLSRLATDRAPYHLINAAINVPATEREELRGRKADFFLFSARHVGSRASGYCRTTVIERVHPDLNLGTALAISGAAAAPTMGTVTIGPLRMILTLLNVRLNYWLPNPGRLSWIGRNLPAVVARVFDKVHFGYLFREMFGRFEETGRQVNLSDGGHIENLGLHELLRRRCRVIIACDAEADPHMRFNGLANAVRLARIDLGVRIDVPLAGLRPDPADGTTTNHCALGTIQYGPGETGVLLYVKSSVTGDESAYVTEYRERTREDEPDAPFPHQTTADQFFDEAQFEAYRALGFHAVNRLFEKRDCPLTFGDGTVLEPADWIARLGLPRRNEADGGGTASSGAESAAEGAAG